MEILKGAPVAKKINGETLSLIEKYCLKPCLAILRLGDSEADLSYIKGVLKTSEKLGVKTRLIEESYEIEQSELLKIIQDINNDDNISGCLMLRPLPKHIDSKLIENSLSLNKDSDCMTEINLGRVLMGAKTDIFPATARAALELLKYYEIPLEGANVVVINRTNVIGRPIASMLINENATVTIAHSKTEDLSTVTGRADIIISAVGKPKLLKSNYLNKNSVVIDIGMGMGEDGILTGDLDIDNVEIKAATPVIGGVGSITNAVLINQMIKSMIK